MNLYQHITTIKRNFIDFKSHQNAYKNKVIIFAYLRTSQSARQPKTLRAFILTCKAKPAILFEVAKNTTNRTVIVLEKMRKMIAKSLILCFSLCALAGNAYEITGKVIKITDGDTVHILDDKRRAHKIRLASIDAPERGEPFAQKSKEMLGKMIFSKRVKADCTSKDRYRRDICTIWLDSVDINRKMVEQGGAWVFRKYYKGEDYYKAEKRAQDQCVGLWKNKSRK